MEQECLSDIEVQAMKIISKATQNGAPYIVILCHLYALAVACKYGSNGDDYRAVKRIIHYLSLLNASSQER